MTIIYELKSYGFDEFHKIRFFFFKSSSWSGCFEKPDASVVSRPSCNGARFVTSNVGGGKRYVSCFERSDLRGHGVCVHWRETDLSAPPIDVVGIASSVSGKRHNGDVDLTAVFGGRTEAGVAHRRGGNFCPAFRRCPFNGGHASRLRRSSRRASRLRRSSRHLRRAGLRLGVANCSDPFDEVAFLGLGQVGVAAHFEKERRISS